MPIFRFPFFYNPYYSSKEVNKDFSPKNNQKVHNNVNDFKKDLEINKTNNSKNDNTNYFFELFGLKLYFDDILIICLLIFYIKKELEIMNFF